MITSQSAEFTGTSESRSEPRSDWKSEVNARLNAHRNRRGGNPDRQPALPGMEPPESPAYEPRMRLAARIAERYANLPTYGERLAAEAAKATRAAEAAAQAALEAEQAALAVTDVLRATVDGPPEPEPPPIQYRVDPASLPAARHFAISPNNQHHSVDPHPQVFDPMEDALVAPAQTLPARVLEFPRELVASRKARPRRAEGPLLEEQTQLRIFEVESDTISRDPLPSAGTAPEPSEEACLPGWGSIRLDAQPRNIEPELSFSNTLEAAMVGRATRADLPVSSREARAAAAKRVSASRRSDLADLLPLHVASFGDRILAFGVDAALVLCAFGLFVVVFAACTAHPPSGKPAMIASAAALVGFIALYQWLFFTFSEGTPGMRFAKIALCTFDDRNPGRKTLQHRVGALFLAALPLGLGFLWALLDDDRLGWHDRMTRTYQRSYR